MEKDKEEFNKIINEATKAQDILAEISNRLEEMGYVRKSKSAMRLVFEIAAWQHRKP